MKIKIGTLFGADLFVETESDEVMKSCLEYLKELSEYNLTESEKDLLEKLKININK